MNNSIERLLQAHTRRHMLTAKTGLGEAARFLVNALLLSHSIRRDTVAIVQVGDKLIVAPGSSLRQLRPDQESAEGWIRAVLRGRGKGLGAVLAGPHIIDQALRSSEVLYTCIGPPGPPQQPVKHEKPITIVHSPEAGECWLQAPCSPSCRAAITNIVLDRVLIGLRA